jgi:hypothetical protein
MLTFVKMNATDSPGMLEENEADMQLSFLLSDRIQQLLYAWQEPRGIDGITRGQALAPDEMRNASSPCVSIYVLPINAGTNGDLRA